MPGSPNPGRRESWRPGCPDPGNSLSQSPAGRAGRGGEQLCCASQQPVPHCGVHSFPPHREGLGMQEGSPQTSLAFLWASPLMLKFDVSAQRAERSIGLAASVGTLPV